MLRRLFRKPALIVRRQDLADRRRPWSARPAGRLRGEARSACARARQPPLSRAFAMICSVAAIVRCASCSCRRLAASRASARNCWPCAWASAITLLPLRLDARERGVDLLGVRHAQGDLLAPLFEHAQHGLIGEPVQHRAHDREADHLGRQVRPVHAEGSGESLRPGRRRSSAPSTREESWSRSASMPIAVRLTSRGTRRRRRSLRRRRSPGSTEPESAVAAPGFRPTASDAFMPMRPTAMAAPNAARPMWRLPIMCAVLPLVSGAQRPILRRAAGK